MSPFQTQGSICPHKEGGGSLKLIRFKWERLCFPSLFTLSYSQSRAAGSWGLEMTQLDSQLTWSQVASWYHVPPCSGYTWGIWEAKSPLSDLNPEACSLGTPCLEDSTLGAVSTPSAAFQAGLREGRYMSFSILTLASKAVTHISVLEEISERAQLNQSARKP